MRRTVLLVVVGVLVVLLGGTATAGQEMEYEVVLEGDDGVKDFELYGTYEISIEDGETIVDLSVWIDHLHPELTFSELKDFEMAVRYRPNETVASKSLSFTMDDRYASWSFTTDRDFRELNDLAAWITYTGENATGHSFQRETFGYIPFRTVDLEQELESFESNASTVYRDSEIYVNGSVALIQSLNVSWAGDSAWTVLDVRDDRFGEWLALPDGEALGGQSLTLELTTTQGNTFERTVDVTVENRPPQVDVSAANTVVMGENLSVSVDATDETGVDTMELVFPDTIIGREGDTFTVDTRLLPADTYNYTVRVTDEDGGTTTVERTVDVITEEEAAEQDGSGRGGTSDGSPAESADETGEEGEELSDTSSVLISIVERIRSMLASILVGE